MAENEKSAEQELKEILDEVDGDTPETTADMSEFREPDSAPLETVNATNTANVIPMHAGGRKTPDSLSMTLTGDITLKLQYNYEGEWVSVNFIDQSLIVKLANGTEFKIPVSRLKEKTKAG